MTTHRAYSVEYVERLEAQRSVWRFFFGLSTAGLLVCGILLSLVGQSHDRMAEKVVRLTVQR